MKKQNGFNLISLLLATAIAAILTTIAAPSMAKFQSSYSSASATALMHRHLANARTLAINNEQTITVCGVSNDGSCLRSGFKEIAMFYDVNNNATMDQDEVIYYVSQLEAANYLTLRASLRRRYIRFSKYGTAKQAGSFIYCDPDAERSAARVTVSMSGRSYQGRDTNGDGIVEGTNGRPIRC